MLSLLERRLRGPRGFRAELVWAKRAVSDIDSTRLATAMRTTDCVDVCARYRLEKARTVLARSAHANRPKLLGGQSLESILPARGVILDDSAGLGAAVIRESRVADVGAVTFSILSILLSPPMPPAT